MLGWRLLLAPLLIGLLVAVLVADAWSGPTAPVLWGLCFLVGLRSAYELTALLRTRSFEPSFPLTAVCSLAIISANWYPRLWAETTVSLSIRPDVGALGPAMLVFSLSVLVLFIYRALKYRAPGNTMETLGAELLIVVYVGVLFSLTAQLRWVGGEALSYLPLGSLIIVTKCGDTAAYTFGRLFGRAKLVPYLSPGKTWAGAFGAVVGAAAGACLYLHYGLQYLTSRGLGDAWPWAVVYGVVVGVVGLLGDLSESLIKRDVGQKDSAALLPGFGGMLDLLDSVVFAAPAAYLLWLVLPLTG